MTLRVGTLSAWLFPVVSAMLLVSCLEPDQPDQDMPATIDLTPEVEAAVVAGADLVGRVDVEAMRGAGILLQLEETNQKLKEIQEANRRFEDATGLRREDLRFVVFSANTTTLNLEATRHAGLEALDAVVGMALSKPLTLQQLTQGIQAMATTTERPAPKVAETEIAGRPALILQPEGPEENAAYVALSPEATTIFLTVSQASLAAALTRADRGEIEVPSPSVVSAQTVLPRGTQLRLAFVVPDRLRARLRAALESDPGNAQMAMLSGFLESFKDLQSLSLGVGLSQDMSLNLICDLGSEESARKAATIIETIVAPMLKAALQSAEQSVAIPDSFQVAPDGTVLTLGLKLTAEDLDSMGSRAGRASAGR